MRKTCPVLAALVFLAAPGHVSAEALAPGAQAPAWTNLPGVDGRGHSLADLADAKLVVVVFTCNSCPFSVDYEDRLEAFAKQYRDQGVRLVAINVNNEEEDRLPKMKERAEEKGFSFPYLYDETQAIGKAYGAKVTPHLFVLGPDRKIEYVGAFDDSRKPAKVKRQYVRDAVESLLEGKEPSTRQTRAAGCSIRYE